MRPIDINARFLTQPITGVQRVAEQLVLALDRELGSSSELRKQYSFRLVAPSGERRQIALNHISTVEVGRLRGQQWEQLELPAYTAGRLLLNLCNTAPVGVRSIVVIHDASVFAVPQAYSPAFRSWYRILIPLLGRRALRLITVSDFSRKELSRRAGIPPDKFDILPLGADHVLHAPADKGVFHRLPVGPGRYILSVGSRSPHKNLGALIAAVAALGVKQLPLVLAGGANARVFAGSVRSESSIDAGYVTDGELRALYENALCFVFPSLYEGFGLPPLEAMLCGCPALVSNAGSLPEVCGSGARYCNPGNPDDIARGIREIVAEPGVREQQIRAGAARAREFTWQRSVHELISILDRIPA
ncbi:MAG TPA: glycosyltransferase family 1 protein [Gemmatimonadales bacterium]